MGGPAPDRLSGGKSCFDSEGLSAHRKLILNGNNGNFLIYFVFGATLLRVCLQNLNDSEVSLRNTLIPRKSTKQRPSHFSDQTFSRFFVSINLD